jgi:hypothetical protein
MLLQDKLVLHYLLEFSIDICLHQLTLQPLKCTTKNVFQLMVYVISYIMSLYKNNKKLKTPENVQIINTPFVSSYFKTDYERFGSSVP